MSDKIKEKQKCRGYKQNVAGDGGASTCPFKADAKPHRLYCQWCQETIDEACKNDSGWGKS